MVLEFLQIDSPTLFLPEFVMSDAVKKVKIQCCVTGVTRDVKVSKTGEPKLPMKWKRLNGKVYSPEGLRQHYVIKAPRLPVVSTVEGWGTDWSIKNRTEGRASMRAALRAGTQECAMILNWAMVEFAKSDNEPCKKVERGYKLPKWSSAAVPLYGIGRALYPNVDSQTFGSLLRTAGMKYSAERFTRRVLQKISLPSFRHGVPVPIPAKDYSLRVDPEQKTIFCRYRLQGKRYTSQLRTTPDRKHHTTFPNAELLRQVVLGNKGLLGEMKIILRENPDGPPDILMAFSGYFPVQKVDREDRFMSVVTQADKFLTVVVEGREQPWNLNDDQVRKILMAHKAQLHRLSEDDKFERRSGIKRYSSTPQAFRERIVRKYHNRMNDYTHKVSAMLVGLAVRNKVCLVKYDYSEKGWCREFPWFELKTKLANKLAQVGIRLEVTGDPEDQQGEVISSEPERADDPTVVDGPQSSEDLVE